MAQAHPDVEIRPRTPLEERTTLGSITPPPPAGDALLREFIRLALSPLGQPDELPKLREWVDLAEAWRITCALEQHGGNRSAAARSLGIGRRTLYTKMEKLGIAPTWQATAPRAVARSEP